MEHLPALLISLAALLVSYLTPGPNMMAIVSTSVSSGRTAGRSLATGIAAGSTTWATLTAVGLSAVLARYASVLIGIKIAGGLYLGFLAFKAFRRAANPPTLEEVSEQETKSLVGHFRTGYLIQMTNPKAILAWIAIVSIAMTKSTPTWVPITLVVAAGLSSYLVHNIYAVLFSTKRIMDGYLKVRRGVDSTLGLLFGAVSVKLLSGAAHEL